MNLWQWLAVLLRMETLYLAVVKIYPKGGICGSYIPVYPSGGNISQLYPAQCYSTKVYIGGIYYTKLSIIQNTVLTLLIP